MWKIEIHDRGQSRFGGAFDHRFGGSSDHGLLDYQDLITLHYGKHRSLYYYVNYYQQNYVNRPSYPCDETNSVQMESCLLEFYSFILNCTLPWMKTTNHEKRVCDRLEDLAKYREVFSKINKHPHYYEDLEAFGCTKQNCLKNSWKREVVDEDLEWVYWLGEYEVILYFSNNQDFVRELLQLFS